MIANIQAAKRQADERWDHNTISTTLDFALQDAEQAAALMRELVNHCKANDSAYYNSSIIQRMEALLSK